MAHDDAAELNDLRVQHVKLYRLVQELDAEIAKLETQLGERDNLLREARDQYADHRPDKCLADQGRVCKCGYGKWCAKVTEILGD